MIARAVALLLTLLAVPLAVPLAAQARDVTAQRQVGPFTAVTVDGSFMLHITVGTPRAVTLAGDRYLIDNLRVATANGVLTIARRHGLDLPHHTITITIDTPDLAALDVRGLVRASVTGLRGPAFALTNNGAAAMSLSGSVAQFHLISRGVASIDAGALHAASLTMMMRGQGNMRLYASHDATITLYGEGHVDLLGHPPLRRFKTLAYGVISLK